MSAYPLTWLDTLAFLVFMTVWVGYTQFARFKARRAQTLSSLVRLYRNRWMQEMLRRENRIGDASLIGNVKSVATFFASTTMLILAGVLTAIPASDRLAGMLSGLHLGADLTREVLQFKLLVLALVFVYAFFKFTWSVRQHIIAGIMVGAAPWDPASRATPELPPHLESIAMRAAKVSDLASHDFNYGLRAYYFALALMAWVVNIWLFLGATLLVVTVLYRREFRSRVVDVLKE